MKTLKERIHYECVRLVNEKVAMHQAAMQQAQEAANSEQRSTAGDKYDTSRAMSQNERDMYARQLEESLHMKKTLDHIDPGKVSDSVLSGALAITARGNYYLSASCGRIVLDGKDYFAVSALTPIGQALLGKKTGEDFYFGGQFITVDNIL